MTPMTPTTATDIIESMVGDLGKPFYINTPNRGAVTNMRDDAFLELLCDVDMSGPSPRPVGRDAARPTRHARTHFRNPRNSPPRRFTSRTGGSSDAPC